MRKLSSLFMVLALAGAACGDSDGKGDDGKTNKDAGSDAGSVTIPDAGNTGGDPYPECGLEEAVLFLGDGIEWTDPAPLTQSQVNTCINETCAQTQTYACIRDKCPNGADFVDCTLGHQTWCAVNKTGAKCTNEYDNWGCCIDTECGDIADPDAQVDCAIAKCADPSEAFSMCAQKNCAADVRSKCVGKDPVGVDSGTPMGDAGTGDAGTKARSSNRASERALRIMTRLRASF